VLSGHLAALLQESSEIFGEMRCVVLDQVLCTLVSLSLRK